MLTLLLSACTPATITLQDGADDDQREADADTDADSDSDADSDADADADSDADADADADSDADSDSDSDTDADPEPIDYGGHIWGVYYDGHDDYECEGDAYFTVASDGSLIGEANCQFGRTDFEGPLDGSVSDGRARVDWSPEWRGEEQLYEFTGTVDEEHAALECTERGDEGGVEFLIEAVAI